MNIKRFLPLVEMTAEIIGVRVTLTPPPQHSFAGSGLQLEPFC